MSESPKMGLFGSKDKTKETKKDDAPGHYAPYCIDSDTETYDTEALSIMDINDIIGVQSEPVSDSTLESEIAALSQIITESKTEGSQNTIETNLEPQEKIITTDEGKPSVENIDNIQMSETNDVQLQDYVNEACVGDVGQLNKENELQYSENTLGDITELTGEQKKGDTKDTCESSVSIDSNNISCSETNKNMNKMDTESIQSSSECIFVTSEVFKHKETVNKSIVNDQEDNTVEVKTQEIKVTKIESGNNICGSLQLIGEAYSSEDSQEMYTNDDSEPKEIEPLIAAAEECSIESEKKQDIPESCDSEQNVNNVSETSENIDSDKTYINTDTSVEENKVHKETDISTCSIELKHAEELLDNVETTKDIVSNEYKESIISQCEKEDNTNAVEKADMNEEIVQAKEIKTVDVFENSATIEHHDLKLNKEETENLANTCDMQPETYETTIDTNNVVEKVKENEECMTVEEEESDESIKKNMDIQVQESSKSEEEELETDINVEKEELETDINVEKEERQQSEETIKKQKEEECVNEDNKESPKNKRIVDVEDETDKNEECRGKEETYEIKDKGQDIEECISEKVAGNQESEECINKDIEISQYTEEYTNKEINEREENKKCKSEEVEKSQENKEVYLSAISASDNASNNVDNDAVCIQTNEKNVQEEVKSEIEHAQQYQLENVEVSNASECQELDTLQETNDSEVLQDQVEEIYIKKPEATEEAQQFSPTKCDQNLKSSEENSASLVCDNLKSFTNEAQIESNANVQLEDKSLDLVSTETEVKESPTNKPKDVEMISITEVISKHDLNIASICESPVEIDNIMKATFCNLQSDIASPMDISVSENDSKSNIDTVEETNDTEEKGMERIQKIEDTTTEEQVQELNEVSVALKSTELKETLDEADTFKEESIEIFEKPKDLNIVNLLEQQEAKVQSLDEKEGGPPEIVVQEEEQSIKSQIGELKEPSTHNIDEEASLKQIPESNEKPVEENESVETDTSDSNEKVSSLSLLDDSEIPISPKNVNKENVEEVDLSSEKEEIKPLSEVEKSDTDEKSEKMEVTEETDKEVSKDAIEDIEYTKSLNIEESSVSEIALEKALNINITEDSVPNENDEIIHKQHKEDNYLESNIDKDSVHNALETANNLEVMFPGEQCQGTQDIVSNILDNVSSTSDIKNMLCAEANVTNDIENVLQQSIELPLEEAEMEELPEKLPQDSVDILNKDMENPISSQNIDSLEGLLGLDLISEGENTTLKVAEVEEQNQELPKDVDMSLLLEQSNNSSDVTEASDDTTDVISSRLRDENIEKEKVTEVINDNDHEEETNDTLKTEESIIAETTNKDTNEGELQESTDLPEHELDIDFDEAPLESVEDLGDTDSKLDVAPGILLLQNVEQTENINEVQTTAETSQPSSEISELESAVKFLQESEEQAIDSPLVLSPKMVESVVDDISKQTGASTLFVPDEGICEDPVELDAELHNIATDSISISEAEIISEAAKLESERKLAEQEKLEASISKFEASKDKQEIVDEEKITTEDTASTTAFLKNVEIQRVSNLESEKIPEIITPFTQSVLKTTESIPKISILEERLKEPPKIEIPFTDVTKISLSPTISKDSLLIQKDARLLSYQKMLESLKLSEKLEPRILETPRKDSEKHDFENVGSPRIILKIAKSAITDCGEPRSPKSPKIRSATNSPNPEDSPGQKLGKIKLKLSKGGHPSIISNENVEESGQWYTEGSSSLSPIGMKIKLSKSGDASIISSEKHETIDDSKEGKHKFEEVKRTESPIGMKIKLSKSGDASIVQHDSKEVQLKHKEKLEIIQGSPKRTESPIGMKIKLSKSGDASIIQPERQDSVEEHRDNTQLKAKDKLEVSYDSPKRTDSPIGMKIKLSKSGDASIVSPDMPDENREACKSKDKSESPPEVPKRTDSPIGMKIKLAKTKGGASIIPMENTEDPKEKLEIPDVPKRTESPLGMKIKLSKTGDASIIHSEIADESKDIKLKEKMEYKEKSEVLQIKSGEKQEEFEEAETPQEPQKVESSIGMKIKLSKFGDASIVSTEKQEQSEEMKPLPETPKRIASPIGMKIKLSKTGDASIIQPESSEDINKTTRTVDAEHSKATDTTLGMKIKLLKTGDASIVESEKKERQQRRRDTESPLEMKIKLSKTGHPTIIACDNHGEPAYKLKETAETSHGFAQKYQGSPQASHKEPALKILKTGHSTILQSNRAELTIEPVQSPGKKTDNAIAISPKRKEITISPVETKKSKLEAQLTQILPEVTIQPVASRDQKQFMFDPKSSAISLQQMNVISQEISITQVRPQKPPDPSINEKLKDILSKTASGSPMNSDCEIIENRPELIIVNENSNSSQDVVIIEEVSPNRVPEIKIPKRRGRPRRNPIVQPVPHPQMMMPRDPLSLDDAQQVQSQAPHVESRENERPKRTCRSQKSYAPPKRGRGRGRGKRKLDSTDLQMIKKPRIEQDLTAIEASTTSMLTIDGSAAQQASYHKSPELYKALKQPSMDSRVTNFTSKAEKRAAMLKGDGTKNINVVHNILPDSTNVQLEAIKGTDIRLETVKGMPRPISVESKDSKDKKMMEAVSEKMQKTGLKSSDERCDRTAEQTRTDNKDILVPPGHPNWLTPTSKRSVEGSAKHENMSTVQVMDEETRMSAESGSRSQTPARNISAPASETIVNEESQGSVLSTATTESEKVKVKNRRMEINFDPDEGPFTVDKIAEYEWPLDRKGETFMIQEQISQYLGVKSFKRKYPDLKRRVVDMEERNYLRENGLVSEAMCDMGLTAICSSEVLDVMCSDFPDQYEEYRKHMREKQVKEHSKKQKELSAAANAEKNRIDLAEMAVQSALAWNINLNKARRENRKCSLDLQTFTIHVPKKQQKVDNDRKIGHYPVALIPGQYTDYYREYTPAELRYYPLNTVLYGPMRPNERKFDSQSEGSQSDSDSDSSSDDSSSSSSEGTQDTEGSQSTMDDVDMEIVNQKEEVKLKCKMCLKMLNKHSKNEVLIQCGTCNGHVHPSCIDLTLDMVPHIQSYSWQCTDCKTCAQCHDPADEDKMLFCDMCDRGYHIYCVGLRRVPQGRWHCQECAVCANCGSREPGGVNSDRNSVAQWQHEYKKGDKNTRVYVSTLCVPCSKLWRKGRYCPHCSRCHTASRLDLEANLVHCSACDKYLHLGCVETKGVAFDRKNYLCDFCAPNRQHIAKPLVSRTMKT